MNELGQAIWGHLPGILQALSTGVVIWGWWSLKRIFVTRADFAAWREASGTRMGALEDRQLERDAALRELQTRLGGLPSGDMLHALELRLESISGEQRTSTAQMEALRESLAGISQSINRIQTYLMEHR